MAGALLLTACSQPQPGCTAENCKLMVSGCRVEFIGGPQDIAACGFDRPASPPDFTKYCVDACNAHQGNGQLATCIAGKADACRDGGFNRFAAVIQPCLDAAMGTKGPVKSCDDTCSADRRTCDDKCSGGKACDSCLRAGRNDCAMHCSDAGFVACLDCSGQCGLKYVACADHCPREP